MEKKKHKQSKVPGYLDGSEVDGKDRVVGGGYRFVHLLLFQFRGGGGAAAAAAKEAAESVQNQSSEGGGSCDDGKDESKEGESSGEEGRCGGGDRGCMIPQSLFFLWFCGAVNIFQEREYERSLDRRVAFHKNIK